MKTIVRLILASAGILALVSCSLVFHKKPAPLNLTFPLLEDSRLEIDGEISDGLRTDGARVYAATKKGWVYAVDANSKKIAWKFAAKAPVVSFPSVGSGRIVLADKENRLTCLSAEGKSLWEKKLAEAITSEVVQNADKLFFTIADASLIALDAASGNEDWRFTAGEAIQTGPVFWNHQILIGTAGGKIRFLTAFGQLGSTFEIGGSFAGPLFVDANKLYFTLDNGTFICLALASKRILWKIRTGSLTALPVTDDERIYFATSNRTLFGLNKENGNLDWWRILTARTSFKPAIVGEQIAASLSSSTLVVYRKENGEPVGIFNADDAHKSEPVYIGGYLWIGTFNPETSKGAIVVLKSQPPKAAAVPKKEGPKK
ncbi:MAG: PQQ-binding-like beta-propeller repeat protein [Candidatus Aminicenantales bacterium]